ncbi:MAG: hypothetical protein INH41_05365 [Myxococcaceae bacterium]|jgi:hypothetical protein|nr:hypothetical protein [Myxococcaceae bacterium]MCA3011813.1 hypothetical protein [Myxococcaceae bacterium]
MKTYVDERMRAVLTIAQRASSEFEAGDTARALRSFTELSQRLGALHLTSGWAEWGRAACLDTQGALLMAFDAIQSALRLDPLSPSAVRSFELIAQRLRDALASAAPDDPAVARLYELLRGAGEADVASHLAMVRHLCATGALERAEALAATVTTLSPASRDAWRARAEVARRRNDPTAAAAFEAEALARELDDVPFAPGAPTGPLA